MRLLLVTPTGDRHASYALCEWMLSRQTDQDFEHLVIDDGALCTSVWSRARYLRRQPSPQDSPHTLAANLRAALPIMREYDAVAFIEDDDFYGVRYVQQMKHWIDGCELAGEVDAKYYHLQQGYRRIGGQAHVSLCRTGMRSSVFPTLAMVLQRCEERKSSSVDIKLWRDWKGSQIKWRDDLGTAGLSVAIKGMPGRPNLSRKGQPYEPDPDRKQLYEWLQDDDAARRYMALEAGLGRDRRPVVFSAVFGGYDDVQTPRVIEDGVRYVLFTDRPYTGGGYEVVRFSKVDQPSLMNRMCKIMAHRWFSDAPWTLYHDGNYQIVANPSEIERSLPTGCDMLVTDSIHQQWSVADELAAVCERGLAAATVARKQLAHYRAAGYCPELDRAVRAGVLLRRNTDHLARFNESWWHEVQEWTHRDQLSFGYVAQQLQTKYQRISVTQRAKWFAKFDHLMPRIPYAEAVA